MAEVPVPAAVREGDRWELIEEDEQDLGGGRLVSVDAVRALYGDSELRDRVRAATGVDRLWRSFFVSRLTTTPPLTPGISDLVVRTIAEPQARKRFVADLEDRGFEGVTKRDEGQLALDSGERARTTRFSGVVPVDAAGDVTVDAWLAIWDRDQEMVVAGGIYPVSGLGEGSPFAPPGEYRRELMDLVRAVE